MVDYLAPPELRLLGRRATAGAAPASGDDLKNVITNEVPHESLVWADRTLLYLDRNDNASLESLAGSEPICIVPNSGPGRWKACAGRGMSQLNYELTASSIVAVIVVTGANEWSIMPDATWIPSSGRTPCFQADANGRVTYNGPDTTFNMKGLVSVSNSTGANSTGIELGFSVDGANIGGTGDQINSARQVTAADQLTRELVFEDYVFLAQGSVIGMMFRSTNGDDFVLERAKFMFRPTQFDPTP